MTKFREWGALGVVTIAILAVGISVVFVRGSKSVIADQPYNPMSATQLQCLPPAPGEPPAISGGHGDTTPPGLKTPEAALAGALAYKVPQVTVAQLVRTAWNESHVQWKLEDQGRLVLLAEVEKVGEGWGNPNIAVCYDYTLKLKGAA